MPLHVVVDGYNLIRQSSQLSALDLRDIQEGREGLQDLLVEYRKARKHRITVVFDGTNASSLGMQRQRYHGMDILYSRHGETADTVIKRIAVREKEGVLIVSSDRDIVSFSVSHGAATIGARAFENKVYEAIYSGDSGMIEEGLEKSWKPTTRKKGPRRRLPKKRRRSRDRIGKL